MAELGEVEEQDSNRVQDSFKKYFVRTPIYVTDCYTEGVHPLAKYNYTVRYVPAPDSHRLPPNYDLCLQRHLGLRRDFAKLSQATRYEFVKRILSGWKKNYWQVVQGEEMTKLC